MSTTKSPAVAANIDELSRIGATVRALRAMHDLTQPAFARLLGIGPMRLRSIERGDAADARRFILPTANAAGITLEEFTELRELVGRAHQRLTDARVIIRG